jgi:hypothetical protein
MHSHLRQNVVPKLSYDAFKKALRARGAFIPLPRIPRAPIGRQIGKIRSTGSLALENLGEVQEIVYPRLPPFSFASAIRNCSAPTSSEMPHNHPN